MQNWRLISFLLVLFFATNVFAEVPQKKILVSVGDLKDNENKEVKKALCRQIYFIANTISESGVDVTCREFDSGNFMDAELGQLMPRFDYHLRVLRDQNDHLLLDLTNIHPHHKSDFRTLGWNLKDGEVTKVTKEEGFAKVVSNIFTYIENEKGYKAGLLLQGIHESVEVGFDENGQTFYEKLTKTPISVDKAYSLFEQESDRKINYLRTGTEIGVLLSAALGLYYKNLAYNAVDFDYTLKNGIQKKLAGEAILFDDNDKFANVGHAFAGVLYHGAARANGFKPLEALLIDLASSTTWEFLEYHEVLSINDEIITGVGGYIIGEALYQMSCALIAKGGVVNKTIGLAFTPALGMNHMIDRKKAGGGIPSDCSQPRWSKISAYVGLEQGQKAFDASSYKSPSYGFSSEVINIPGYNKEGSAEGFMVDTALSKILLTANGMNDFKLVAQIASAAYYKRKMGRNENGDLSGYDFALAISHGYRHNDQGGAEDSGQKEEFYGTVNVIGATAHVNAYLGGVNIKAEIGFFGDFAMVKSYALDNYVANGGDLNEESSVIRKRGYYWGLGHTEVLTLSASKGRLEVGASVQSSSAQNIAGRDRLGKNDPSNFRDTYVNAEVYASIKLTKSLSARISHERTYRTGSVNSSNGSSGVYSKTTGALVYMF